jgi:hypothetical protein
MRRGMHFDWLESHEENKPLGRRRHIWVDNIKMDLREIIWSYSDSGRTIGGSCERSNEHSGSMKCLGSSGAAAQLVAFQESLSHMELVSRRNTM